VRAVGLCEPQCDRTLFSPRGLPGCYAQFAQKIPSLRPSQAQQQISACAISWTVWLSRRGAQLLLYVLKGYPFDLTLLVHWLDPSTHVPTLILQCGPPGLAEPVRCRHTSHVPQGWHLREEPSGMPCQGFHSANSRRCPIRVRYHPGLASWPGTDRDGVEGQSTGLHLFPECRRYDVPNKPAL